MQKRFGLISGSEGETKMQPLWKNILTMPLCPECEEMAESSITARMPDSYGDSGKCSRCGKVFN